MGCVDKSCDNHFKMLRITLIGVASTISGKCVHKHAAHFARVTAVKSWIKRHTRGTEDSNCAT